MPRPIRWISKAGLLVVAQLVLVGIVALSPAVSRGHAQTSSNLSISFSTNTLPASQNATCMLQVENVGDYLKDLDVILELPPPLVLFGDNHWIRSSFIHGETIGANLTIFAPSFAAGTTTQGSVVAVYKLLGNANPSTENHTISFLIRGSIDIQVYGVSVNPDAILRGSELTISGNILNRGLVPAMYVNVTLARDLPLIGDSITSTYVGEVDPNAPAPFSVAALVDSEVAPGTYPGSAIVHYRDDLELDHTIAIPVTITVVSELPRTVTAPPSMMSQLLNPLPMMAVLVFIFLLIAITYLRKRRRVVHDT
jgi:hypothetical protein